METHNMRPPVASKFLNNTKEFKLSELGFFMSYECNLNCSYCPHMGVYNKPKDMFMDLDLLKNKLPIFIKKYSDPLMPIGISISGGEPLLYWDKLVDLIDIISKIPMNVKGRQITTNFAMDLSVDQMYYLITHFDSIHISLDGCLESQELRAPGTFNNVMNNILTLKSMNEVNGNRLHISTSITITEENVKYLYDNILFFKKLDIQITGGLDTTSQITNPDMTEERLKTFAKTFFETVKKTKKDFNWPEHSLKQLILQCNRDLPYNTANVLPDGNIYRCPILPVNPIASLHDDYVNINYGNIESFTSVGLKYDEKCNGCEIYKECNYCYVATSSNRDFYCGMLRAINILDRNFNN